jgi:transposase-like protein
MLGVILDNYSIKEQFLRLAVIEQKKYKEIAKVLCVERKQLSKWWDELKDERKKITEIRKLWVRKRFTKIQFPDFYDWYIGQNQRCYYCGITVEEIERLLANKKNKNQKASNSWEAA